MSDLIIPIKITVEFNDTDVCMYKNGFLNLESGEIIKVTLVKNEKIINENVYDFTSGVLEFGDNKEVEFAIEYDFKEKEFSVSADELSEIKEKITKLSKKNKIKK